MGYPSVYPTGVTLYRPDLAWSGYTLFQAPGLGALLIDPAGREASLWKGLEGFPNKLLPGGQILGSRGHRDPGVAFQDQLDLVQVDWEGRVQWAFDHLEEVADPGTPQRWVARQHHDFQREGNPVGYPAPGQEPLVGQGRTLILTHATVRDPGISGHTLLDDRIIEVDWEGRLLWSWSAHEHVEELGFDAAARALLCQNPNLLALGEGIGDWLHINAASWVGPNRWYDQGDQRFHPDNIIWDSREANIIAITSRATGEVVWRLGPRYDGSPAEAGLGWIIGQHHAHIIPRGLPGAGNLLVFDNGGWAGYGEPNPGSPTGRQNALRDYSRVLEIDPITLAIVWQYTPAEAGFHQPLDATRFYSPFVSSAQRLPNGNTLITEGSHGRILEVTAGHELAWEYLSPYRTPGPQGLHLVYRAYRYPYHWVPQLPVPRETAIQAPDRASFRVPGAAPAGPERIIDLGQPVRGGATDFCVIARPGNS
jgi:hypothetical protein